MLSDARFAYRELARKLREAILHMNAAEAGSADIKTLTDLARAHHKQLYQVLEMEAEVAKRSDTVRSPFGNELDLDAARREIGERLAKLAGRS